jgi:hypothetical protein
VRIGEGRIRQSDERELGRVMIWIALRRAMEAPRDWIRTAEFVCLI